MSLFRTGAQQYVRRMTHTFTTDLQTSRRMNIWLCNIWFSINTGCVWRRMSSSWNVFSSKIVFVHKFVRSVFHWTMSKTIVFLSVLFGAAVNGKWFMEYSCTVSRFISTNFAGESCDNSKCVQIPNHYLEIGCKPVTESGSCCPIRCVSIRKLPAALTISSSFVENKKVIQKINLYGF